MYYNFLLNVFMNKHRTNTVALLSLSVINFVSANHASYNIGAKLF